MRENKKNLTIIMIKEEECKYNYSVNVTVLTILTKETPNGNTPLKQTTML